MLNKKYLKIIIVAVFVLLVAVQSSKSFVLDEIDFPVVSHATSESGKPVYYRGELNKTLTGTYHPTLYINSLALFVKAFGYNEISVRFFGVICTLISAYLLLRILRLLIKKNETAEAIFLALFLLNPYTLANTTLPDIDSTVLPVVLLTFIYFSMKYLLKKKDMSNRVVMILGSLFALALWSKLTTPLIIPVFLVCLAVIASKDYKKSILFSIKVTLLGGVMFAVTYFAYCMLLGLSTTYTYTFLLESFTKGTSTNGPLVGAINNLENIRHFIYWPTIPIAGLFGVSLIGVLWDKEKSKKNNIKKLLVIMSVLVTIFYIALIAPFGGFFKYPFPVFGILLLTIVFFYDRYYRDTKINLLYGFVAVALGLLVEHKLWKDSMFLNNASFEYLAVFLIAVVAVYVLLKKYPSNLTSSLFVLFILFSIGFQLSVSRAQAVSPYPTKYNYGQTGLNQAAAYLKSNTAPSEVIWSMKDIGYYVNNVYYESYGYYFDKSLEGDLIKKLQGGKVRYYVVTTGIGQDNIDYYPNTKRLLEKNTVKEKEFGNYIIYKSKE